MYFCQMYFLGLYSYNYNMLGYKFIFPFLNDLVNFFSLLYLGCYKELCYDHV